MHRRHRLTASAVLLVGLLIVAASPVSAATPKRTWQATIGSQRTLATAVLTLMPNYTGSVQVNITGLRPAITYQAMIYKGTCAKPTPLAKLSGIRTDASGHGTRTTTLTFRSGVTIWTTAAGGSIAVRVATGLTAYCAKLSFPLATRVRIARYGIDLPVVHQPSGTYPYCNVAMYSSALSQPGEAGPTFIYAHARVGMFLPLLKASQTNAAAMVGTEVEVWTSDSKVYTYRLTKVLRHQYSTPSYDVTREILWLQTSEGPHGTKNKLFLVGQRLSVEDAPYADAHPKAHIVICH